MLLKTGTLLISGLRCNKYLGAVSFVFIIILSSAARPADTSGSLLEQGRQLFYKSVEDESFIDQAITIFEQILEDENGSGLAQTYIGTLTALRGKHAFLPQNKLKWTNKGLEIMDKGIEASPNNIEALFIHSSTCYYLPFFFHRSEQAQENFKRILQIMPEKRSEYDPEMIKNVLAFIRENGDLDEKDLELLDKLTKP